MSRNKRNGVDFYYRVFGVMSFQRGLMTTMIKLALAAMLMGSPAHAAIFPNGDAWLKQAMTGDPVEWTEDDPNGDDPSKWVCGPWWDCENDKNRDGEHDSRPFWSEPLPDAPRSGYFVLYGPEVPIDPQNIYDPRSPAYIPPQEK